MEAREQLRPLTAKNRDFDGIRRKEVDLWFYSVTVDHRAGALRLMGILSGLVVLFGDVLSEAPEWLDLVLYGDDAAYKCHRLLLPVSSHFAVAHTRRAFGDRPGDCCLRAIFPSPGRRLAVGLCDVGGDRVAPECLRVAQLFPKVPSLKALAPTQSEPPFQVTQLIVMVIFITLSVFAVEGFRPDLARAT